ncbi:type I-E CRISPR-associated protein Cse2/CasB [Gallaecimonas sp. GXIMD4217]|uniref:type I-E CRISPR-associated protein Cse2/CasB n=1 Tax=Gallaecimonas sp. GXIMD4217 TaxID=3131927 RepID=UPI00311AF509
MADKEHKERRYSFEGSDSLLRWWQAMTLPPAELEALKLKPAPTLYRAELKRAEGPEGALLTQGFRALWLKLPERARNRASWSPLAWATIAASLSHVRQLPAESPEQSFATSLGRIDPKTDKPRVSELRFQQLQNARSPEDFFRRLRRLVKLLGGSCNPQSLAADTLSWFAEHHQLSPRRADKRIALRWAMDYYQAADKAASKDN